MRLRDARLVVYSVIALDEYEMMALEVWGQPGRFKVVYMPNLSRWTLVIYSLPIKARGWIPSKSREWIHIFMTDYPAFLHWDAVLN